MWIKCSERMPESPAEFCNWVLVYSPSYGGVADAYWSERFQQWFDQGSYGFKKDDVTHWMPMPAGPL